MNPWHDIPEERISPESFQVVIEISAGYELDKKTGLLRLDRILYTSTHYPSNYGFIPLTYGEDDDPLDVLVLCSESINPLTIVECYPIGVIRMIDQGKNDEKIIAICKNDPRYNSYNSLEELPKHIEDEIRHFFQVYKMLEEKDTIVPEAEGRMTAEKIIREGILRYKEKFAK